MTTHEILSDTHNERHTLTAARNFLAERFFMRCWSVNFDQGTFEKEDFDEHAQCLKSRIVSRREFIEQFEPEDYQRISDAFDRMRVSGDDLFFEARIRQNDNAVSWVQVQGRAHRNDRRVTGASGFILDVTNNVHTRLMLNESEQRFKAIFNQTFQFIGLLDRDGTLIEANETALEFGGIELADVRGKKFWDTPWWSGQDGIREALMKAIQTAAQGKLVRYEVDMSGLEGFQITVELVIRPVFNDDAQVHYLIPEARDISDRREVHEQLIALNRELESKIEQRTRELKESNDDLESFAYSVSHDLRTPLRAIRGFSEILIEEFVPGLDPEGASLVHRIHDSSRQMGLLIDDLLAFSRTSRTDMQRSSVRMSDVFQRAIAEGRAQWPNAEIRVEDLPTIMGDEALLTQVGLNLVSNALKYSSRNTAPRVRIWSKERDADWEFHVSDNGIGFNPDQARDLFRTFNRLQSAKSFEGNGVGLSIVKKIVERHGGRVWATGKPNEGAVFSFTIPKAPMAS